MSRHASILGTLTIPVGTQESNIIQIREMAMLVGLVFYCPVTAFDGTVAVEAASVDSAAAADHRALYVNSTAVTITAGRAEQWDVAGVASIMLDSSSNEDPAVAVVVVGIFDL